MTFVVPPYVACALSAFLVAGSVVLLGLALQILWDLWDRR